MIPADSHLLNAVAAMAGTTGAVARGRGRRGRARLGQTQDADEDSDLSSELSCDTDTDTTSHTSSSMKTSSVEDVVGGRGHGRGDSRERVSAKGKRFGRGRGMKMDPEMSLSSSDLSTDSSLSPACSMSQLSMMEELLPPQQRVAGYFPGSAGRLCKLESNHFTVNLKIPNGMIYMYDVTIEPPWSRPYRKSDKKLYHDAVKMWKKVCPATEAEQSLLGL